MRCTFDADLDDTAVELRDLDRATVVRLWSGVGDDWVVEICAEVLAEDLRAVVHGITLLGDVAFADFFAGLAEEFRGWEGTRTWQNYDQSLRIDAVHGSGGRVELRWTVSPGRRPFTGNSWSGSVVVGMEAGEGMRRLAVAVSRLVGSDDVA